MSGHETNADLDALALCVDRRLGVRTTEAVCVFLRRFVCYPSEHALVAHALWIMHTHLMDVWDSTPRIAFLSAEPASGKTRALEITELLVPHPVATVNVSPAYLFRKVGSDDRATILFDEIDTVFGARAKDHEDIRGLLNAGHRRGATTGRCVIRGKEIVTEELPAYAAVALAGLGWLPDTILSRSIIIRMRRRHAGEHVQGFRRRIHEIEGRSIREQIEVWARTVARDITWPELPAQIADRDADVWEPLLAIADVVGEDWPDRTRRAAIALVSESKEVEPSLGVKLLQDLRAVFGEVDEISSKALIQALHRLEESPWADIKGKPLDERGLAQRLRQYGVKSKTIRVLSNTPKGYSRADLVDVWARYLPSAATSATTATTATLCGSVSRETVVGKAYVADVADVAASSGQGRACAHCGGKTGQLLEASDGGDMIWLHVACKDAYQPGDFLKGKP